ncbi:MAG: NAD(P)-dependent alcohol dehydrogenase [Planctomycetota bacterium]
MHAYQIQSDAGISDAIVRTELPDPTPKAGEVVIAVKACSLNYRDTIIAKGGYPRNDTRPVIALSDCAGEIVEVGADVVGWQVGDRVSPNFLRDHTGGATTDAHLHTGLGGSVDGVLAQNIAMPAHSLVRIPEGYSFEQAATLPCAALTAWNALTSANTAAGQSVLLLGTGGVSVFGLQFAHAMGCRTIVTSSSNAKLDQAKALGADVAINYADHPEWHEQVRAATDGVGVDHVIEVGGNGTLQRSLQSTAVGGTVSLIGLLSDGQPNILPALLNAQTIRGIYVGSAEQFRAMNRCIEQNKIEPIIDRTFGFDEVHEAYAYFASQKHVGKVVITV